MKSKRPIACIVLPTYNEAENVKILLPEIFEQAAKIPSHELHVLVVDDISPDGTADVVMELMSGYPNLHLLTGQKDGLGRAYQRGLDHAVATLEPEVLLQMDADLQHNPKMLPLFISLSTFGFDIVIGSRFVTGGSTPNFGFRRRMMSRVGNMLLQYVAGLPRIKDCTSGYRLIRASFYKQCDLSKFSTTGYSFQSSLLFEILRHGAKPLEIPITFPDREFGYSKLGLKDQMEFLLNLFKIRFRKSEEFVKFCIVGASGVLINLGAYAFLTRSAGMPHYLGSPLAIELSIITNFILNNAFTFQKRNAGYGLKRRFAQFHMVSGIAGIVNFATLLVFVGLGLYDILGQFTGIALGTFINYYLNSRWTWKEFEKSGTFALDAKSAGAAAGALSAQSSARKT